MKITERFKNLFKKGDDITDGYHTFQELYDYRRVYNAFFFNSLKGKCKVYKSKRHSDGTLCFGGGWFIVVAELPTGQVTNHYEEKYWNDFDIPVFKKAEYYDGHTPIQALERMEKIIPSELEANEHAYEVIKQMLTCLKSVTPGSNELDPIIGGSLGMFLLGYEPSFHDVDIIISPGTYKKYREEIVKLAGKAGFMLRLDSDSVNPDFKAILLVYQPESDNPVAIDILESSVDYDSSELNTFRGIPIADPAQTYHARVDLIAKKQIWAKSHPNPFSVGEPGEKWIKKNETYQKKHFEEIEKISMYNKK